MQNTVIKICIVSVSLFIGLLAHAEKAQTPQETKGYVCSANYWRARVGGGYEHFPIKDSTKEVGFKHNPTVDLENIRYAISLSRRPQGDIQTWIYIYNKRTKSSVDLHGVIFGDNRPIVNLNSHETVDGEQVWGLTLVCEPFK